MNASTPKWTKGPWTAKWSKYAEGVFIVQAGMPSNRVLARFDGDGDGPDEQEIASARLIAAAPDLAEALNLCREYLQHCLGSTSEVNPYPAIDAALRKAGAL